MKKLVLVLALLLGMAPMGHAADVEMDALTDGSATPPTSSWYLIGYNGATAYRFTILSAVATANALTASALAADPANCTAGQIALGVTAAGVAECTASPTVGTLTVIGTSGGYARTVAEAASSALSGATGTVTLNIPTAATILGVQLRVDTAITGATSWDAAFSGGNTAAIVTGAALALNTKINSFSGGLTTNTTQITLTAGGSNFTGGVVRAIVYYESFTAMADN